MIICFECSPSIKAMMDELLSEGRYSDISELIATAITNQTMLENRLAQGGVLVIDQTSSLRVPDNGEPAGDTNERVPESKHGSSKSVSQSRPGSKAKVLNLFSLEGFNGAPRPSISIPDDYWTPGIEVPLDRWIFGQHNKLLPVKTSCRALAHLLTEEPKGVFVDEAALRISSEAALLGDALVKCDRQQKIDRDKALSTAFPTSVDKSGKARTRYANQFVASVNKQGQVSGALIDFKLINYKPSKKPRLILTDLGWEFALMRNPILDQSCKSDASKFSEEEVRFFLKHIVAHVRSEEFAYLTILRGIDAGANTPDLLDDVLRELVPADRMQRLTASFLSSQRSGAISRMSDLGLVERAREGVRVTYISTNLGRAFASGVID
jgi:hypothetical protein